MSRRKASQVDAKKEPIEVATRTASDGEVVGQPSSVRDYITKTVENQAKKKAKTALEVACEKLGLNPDDIPNWESTDRSMVYAFIVYPESAPSNWMEILRDMHVRGFISPLHNGDIENGTGHAKKEHWHVEIFYDSLKSVRQFEEMRDAVGGVGREYVQSAVGYARYLCHLDDPNKTQYDPADIIELGGMNWNEFIRKNSDCTEILKAMQDYIDEHDVEYYDVFSMYCRRSNPIWFDVLVNRYTAQVKNFILSRHTRKVDERNRDLEAMKLEVEMMKYKAMLGEDVE